MNEACSWLGWAAATLMVLLGMLASSLITLHAYKRPIISTQPRSPNHPGGRRR